MVQKCFPVGLRSERGDLYKQRREGKARLQVNLKWDLILSSQILPLNENMAGFGEAEKVVAFSDELKYVGVFKMLDIE